MPSSDKPQAALLIALSLWLPQREGNRERSGSQIQSGTQIKIWGKSAPRAAEQLKKGDKAFIEGKLKSYEVDGQRRWEVVVLNWRSLAAKSDHLLPPDPPHQNTWNAVPGGWS